MQKNKPTVRHYNHYIILFRVCKGLFVSILQIGKLPCKIGSMVSVRELLLFLILSILII